MQTRKMSLLEANLNAGIGLIVSYLFTYLALPLFGLHPNPWEAGYITACFFFLSIIRGYIIRRFFINFF